jgi:hypothetical protein
MEVEKVPAIGFSFSAEIGQKLSLVAQTHIDRDAPLDQINTLMDKVRRALEHQKAAAELIELRQKLKYDEKKLRQLKEDFAEIERRRKHEWDNSPKRGEFKLSPKEQGERNNALSTIDRYELEIELDKENIAECEAKLAKEPHLKVA